MVHILYVMLPHTYVHVYCIQLATCLVPYLFVFTFRSLTDFFDGFVRRDSRVCVPSCCTHSGHLGPSVRPTLTGHPLTITPHVHLLMDDVKATQKKPFLG